MHKFEVQLAMEALSDARKEWNLAISRFNSEIDAVMARLLNEAAVNKMSVAQVAAYTGMTQTRVRIQMRKHGLNPRTGRNLLAAQAAATLAENAVLMGVEPHEFDLTSPLAYLPMGAELRKFLETNRLSSADLEVIDPEPLSVETALIELDIATDNYRDALDRESASSVNA